MFDFDPQDDSYKPEILLELIEAYSESTDAGKLYLNYPMVESYKHHKGFDESSLERYLEKRVSFDLLKQQKKGYKFVATKESCCSDLDKITKSEFNMLISVNRLKLNQLEISNKTDVHRGFLLFSIDQLKTHECIYVLNTGILFIEDYNPFLIN